MLVFCGIQEMQHLKQVTHKLDGIEAISFAMHHVRDSTC